MKKLLVLGTTPTSIEMVNLAKAQGVYTVVTDYFEPDKSPAKQVADEYWMISTAEVDTLEKKCREEGITAVISGTSEFNLCRMAELCQRLNLPCWCTPEIWELVQKKHNFKKLCRQVGVPVATDYYLSDPPTEEELDQIVLPVVVKPVDMHSNIGQTFCYSKEDVVKGCEYARSLSKSQTVITERMLRGTEYEAHYIMADGEASLCIFAAMLSQPGCLESCYAVTTTATNQLQQYLQEVDPYFKKLLKEAGCNDGVAWLETYLDEDGHFYVLEMGYRMSGDQIEVTYQDATGFDSIAWLLDISLGKKHSKSQLPETLTRLPKRHVFSYIIWSKVTGVLAKSEGVEEIAQIPGVRIVYQAKVGEEFEQYTYMLTVTFSSDDSEELIALVKKINDTVTMTDENGENVLMYYDAYEEMRRIYEEGKAEENKIIREKNKCELT